MEQPSQTAQRLVWLAKRHGMESKAHEEIMELAEKAAEYDRLTEKLKTPDPAI